VFGAYRKKIKFPLDKKWSYKVYDLRLVML
jgi:hypothetical protein